MMSSSQNSNKGYFPCQQHRGRQLSQLCLNNQCRKSPLICPKCKTSDHKTHHTISMSHLATAIDDMRFDKSLNDRVENIMKSIKDMRIAGTESIKEVIAQANKILGEMEKNFQGHLEEVGEVLVGLAKEYYSNPLERLNIGCNKPLQEFQKQLVYYLDQYESKIQNKKELNYKLKLCEKFNDFQENIKENFKELSEQITSCLQKFQQKVTNHNQIVNIQFDGQVHWDETLKHDNIQINNQTISLKSKSPYVCCLANQLFQQEQQDCYRLQLSIRSLNKLVYLGLCDHQQMKQNNFTKWNWKDQRHNGIFCVCSNGQVFSSQDGSIDGEYKMFKFKEGDSLVFEYYAKEGRLRILGDKSQFEMDVGGDVENYRWCAFLGGENDEIDIVSQ